ncbi:hypothetical protein PspLS_04618 [Pyricularia sp. CBS 133598]|nr:hypothetical protein PspLS_04618 [Pyricularia sp. CBS 133598]
MPANPTITDVMLSSLNGQKTTPPINPSAYDPTTPTTSTSSPPPSPCPRPQMRSRAGVVGNGIRAAAPRIQVDEAGSMVQIVGAQLVNSKCEVDHATEEMLKGVSGMLGHLGVVTSLTVKTYPRYDIFSGWLIFDPTNLRKEITDYLKIQSDLPVPKERTHHHFVMFNPQMGKKVFSVAWTWVGADLEQGKPSYKPRRTSSPCSSLVFEEKNAHEVDVWAAWFMRQVYALPRAAFLPGGFPGTPPGEKTTAQAFSDKWPRAIGLKRGYDPDNMFCHAIPQM